MTRIIPPGIYIAEVVDVTDKVSQATQQPYYLLRMALIIDNHHTDLDLYKPISSSPNADWVWQGMGLKEYADVPELNGQRLVVQVTTINFDGSPRNEVRLLGTAHPIRHCRHVDAGAI